MWNDWVKQTEFEGKQWHSMSTHYTLQAMAHTSLLNIKKNMLHSNSEVLSISVSKNAGKITSPH